MPWLVLAQKNQTSQTNTWVLQQLDQPEVVLHHGSYALLCFLASSVAFVVGLGALSKLSVQTAAT